MHYLLRVEPSRRLPGIVFNLQNTGKSSGITSSINNGRRVDVNRSKFYIVKKHREFTMRAYFKDKFKISRVIFRSGKRLDIDLLDIDTDPKF